MITRPTIFLLACLVFLAIVVEAQTFVGCYQSISPTGNDPASTSVTSEAACYTYCSPTASTAPYMYYNSGGSCVCSAVAPAQSKIIQGSDNTGTCPSTAYRASKLVTTFQFNGCSPSANPSSDQSFMVSSPGECFSSCASSGQAAFSPRSNTADTQLYCLCAPSNDVFSPTDDSRTCGYSSFFLYNHNAASSASGIARRQMREKLHSIRRQNSKPNFCPRNMKACNIPNSIAYECIDTTSELESCGGCMFGEYGDLHEIATGTDCSAMRGAILGGTTCQDSACQALACKKGFALLRGVCTPKKD
ncbi:uncharacterized protein I206_106882 [Kwoniella pini CBS 10737]|uniref:Protein CPL1-like domain-containing protein n=1 Tax=Kwoniella pini CBS 10737 TaxID=1296096 RepID=A0A1B9HZZ1_9TREE|nr:uncharacterized protein I206_05572 [Kwoniella pini CBS 10737]OCF48791.1 hypothetical protein I206_05572 [Kwoniella pini CBS 10737]